jgi:hypothetical protein
MGTKRRPWFIAVSLAFAIRAPTDVSAAPRCEKYDGVFAAVSASGKMELFKSLEACEAYLSAP